MSNMSNAHHYNTQLIYLPTETTQHRKYFSQKCFFLLDNRTHLRHQIAIYLYQRI